MTQEEEWIARMARGEPEAADALVRRYYPEILRYCLWHVPDASLAEDAAQETFLKMIRYFDRYRHRGQFRAFLYRIAANTCIDICRTLPEREVSLEASDAEFPYAEPGFEEIHADISLRQLVRSLPQAQRELILLRYGQDLTLREIAEATGLPLRTVQSRLRAALKTLKKELEKGGLP